MKLSELAKRCELIYYGEDIEINSIHFPDRADFTSIAIIKSIDEIYNTNASCLLIKPMVLDTKKSLLYCNDSIDVTAIKIAEILNEKKLSDLKGAIQYQCKNNYYTGKNVKIGKNTVIMPGCLIGNDVVIGDDCIIDCNCKICSNTLIGNNVNIGFGTIIGEKSFYHYYDDELDIKEFIGVGNVKISDNVSIGCNCIVQRGTFSDNLIGSNSKIGNLIDIGHDVIIGENCKIVSQTGIASNVVIGNNVTIFGQVGIANNIKIHDYATVLGKSLVSKDVLSKQTVSGIYARDHKEEIKFQKEIRKI